MMVASSKSCSPTPGDPVNSLLLLRECPGPGAFLSLAQFLRPWLAKTARWMDARGVFWLGGTEKANGAPVQMREIRIPRVSTGDLCGGELVLLNQAFQTQRT